MPEEIENYLKSAHAAALDAIEYFMDEIVEMLEEKCEASDDLFNDYPNGDQYHHETHTDKSYTLIEAAHLLSQLSDHEETDSGLWEGVDDPRRAIEIQAAFTYGNAVMDQWNDAIEDLNEEYSDVGPLQLRRGPKEWSPRKKEGPPIKKFVEDWLEAKRKLL